MHESFVISAVQNNNEVSIWNMETGGRQTTLWASHTPPLSHVEVSTVLIENIYCNISAVLSFSYVHFREISSQHGLCI